MKQLFFVHSAGPQTVHEGSSDFVAWLIAQLGAEYDIKHPLMPSPDNPDYEPWERQLEIELKDVQGDVVIIGHSLGGSVIVKYLATHQVNCTVAGLYLCAAPFWGKDDWQYEPFTLSSDFVTHLPPIGSVHLYHSKDDPFVPYRHAEFYRDVLPGAVLHTIEGDNHLFDTGNEQLLEDIRSL
jgi:predicted alpha/beta hydrolase family esterase